MERNCHSLLKTVVALQFSSEPSVAAPERPIVRSQEVLSAAKSIETSCKGVAKQVLLYCFRLGKCGTFMPLSGVRGESRIAGVWTLFVLVFSSFHRFTSAFCSHAQFFRQSIACNAKRMIAAERASAAANEVASPPWRYFTFDVKSGAAPCG